MGRRDDVAQGLHTDSARSIAGVEGVLRINWAGGQFTVNAAAQIRLQVGADRAGAVLLALFQGPLLLGGVNEAEVVDAGVLLRGGAGFDEVGDGDRGQQTDDGDDDHNLNKRETRLAIVFLLHICLSFCFSAAA